jgi:hypothetical protein
VHERAYLQYIYCKVEPRIQRELSHAIKSRCACVWSNDGYMVAILILLCSLKIYLSFETLKLLQENMGYLIHPFLFFSDAHRSTHCFNHSDGKHVFSDVHRRNIVLSGSRWKACFCAYQQCRSRAYASSVYVILILK